MADTWDAFPTEAPARVPTPIGENGQPLPRITVTPNAPADTWDAFPETKPTDYAGLAKAGGVGVAKGAINIAGLPGDLQTLAGKAGDWIKEHLPSLPEPDERTKHYAEKYGGRGDLGPSFPMPTSQDIQGAIEKITGPFRKPQNQVERGFETAGEFLPAAMAGPGGVARKLVLQDAVPAVASEIAGHYTEGTAAEPYARAGAAITAGLGGAALSRPASATATLQGRLPAGVTQTTIDDARALMVSAKAKGIDLSWPEALSQVAGKPVLSDTQRILESAPQSRARMQEFYGDRPQQFDQAALNEFGQIAPGTVAPSQIGPAAGRAANETLGDVRKTINAASEPFYKNAEGVLLTPQEMALVRTIPGWKEARAAVRKDPQLNSYVAHLPDNSVGFLNEVKKYFDQQAKNSGSKFNPGANQQVQAAHEQAASAVKQVAEIKSADYGTALAIQSQAREQFLQPLLDGPLGRLAKKDVTTQKAINALFPSNPLPNSHNEIATTVSALAAKNPGAATQLVRAHLESTFNEATRSLQGGPNQMGAAGFTKAIVGNPQQRANLQAAIEALPNGRQLWSGFDGFLQAAEATGTRQAKGSLTAFNAAELHGLSGSNPIGEAVKTGLSPGKWWSVVSDKWGQWKLGRNLDELARILTDPNSAPVLKRIANMPSGGREAGYLASRLILQAENAGTQSRETRGQ